MKLFFKIIFKEFYHLISTRNSREFLWLAILYSNVTRYQLTGITFLNYRIQVPDCLSFLWQFKEIFTDEAYKFHASSPMPVIYDCGANVGTSCLYFKELYPQARIIAFEADPSIAELLKKNLESNHVSGVEVISKAVWVDEKGIEIGLEGADGASVYNQGKKTHILSVRLKDLIEAEKQIDLLKIDIEGAEAQVLEDCKGSLENIQHIFIEYHAYLNQPQTLDRILSILSQNRFRYFIRDAQDRKSPLISHTYKSDYNMDLQLNIFAYKLK
jgi:FkbM family methyltransferase